MEKIGHSDASGLPSQQVTGARFFLLNFAPRRAESLALVVGGREHCNPDHAVVRRNFPQF